MSVTRNIQPRTPKMGQAQTKLKKFKNKGVQNFESKEEYFIQNGGILLEKQLALSHGQDVVGQLKILTQKEIKNATNNFDPLLVYAKIREAFIYKGTLDDMLVFIKIPLELEPNPKLANLFLTELSISMVMHHDNMNKIYGCCLETYIPMIVYYYKSRSKVLRHYLHGDMALEKPMKWSSRLSATIDIAYALSYMHNALPKQMVHRDVKSTGIIIDSSFHAILANVAHSVSINPEKKDQRWPVVGTPGYIDPEYIESGKVTDKCDVYSFGVLMLELLTGMDPFEMAKCGKYLVDVFVPVAERNCIMEIVAKSVLEEDNLDEIRRFVQLALKCVAKKGEERPTMISVVEELWRINNFRLNKFEPSWSSSYNFPGSPAAAAGN